MVVKASSSVSVFFDEDEILEREAREEILFKDFPKRLKTIVGLSKGWDKILTGIEFSKIKDYNKTLKVCHSTVGIAILNTSITIVFGFSILVLSNFIPTIYFGIFTGLAMMLAMLLVLTLLPCFLISFKPFGNTN